MVDDGTMTTAPSTPPAALPPQEYAQLTQVRVPLEEAAVAFTQRDANGRTPIIVMPKRLNRIANELVLAAVIAPVAGFVIGETFNWPSLFPLAIVLGILLAVAGARDAFIVRIPEGTSALIQRGGRYVTTIGSGMRILPPWFVVSHLVTKREIPFDVPAEAVPTSDNVRVRIDALITFTITDPYRFVFNISATDFDQVLQAACQEALRAVVRRLDSDQILDLVGQATPDLHAAIGAAAEPYGASVAKLAIIAALPPDEFFHAREARRLAMLQLAEQVERQTLALRRQTDEETLAHQRVVAQVEREREALVAKAQAAEARRRVVELEAEAEAVRLARLEERLRDFPTAIDYELRRARLEVARALAGNTRAVVQVGQADEIARALVVRDVLREAADAAADAPQLPSTSDGLDGPAA
jgi:regulator of protease activity HflC (stomatin/prohibitin superfamily)